MSIIDFVAVFFPLTITATKEEITNGLTVPAFEHEGFVGEEHVVTGIVAGHNNVTIEPSRKAQMFATREEAEDFVARQTVRQSGWMILPRRGAACTS